MYAFDIPKVKHPCKDFTYDFMSIVYNDKNKVKKWTVNFVYNEFLGLTGIITDKHKRSFATFEEAKNEFDKYNKKEWTIFDENQNVVEEGDNRSKEEIEELNKLVEKYCPNVMGVGCGLGDDGDDDLEEGWQIAEDKNSVEKIESNIDSILRKYGSSLEEIRNKVEEEKQVKQVEEQHKETKKWWQFWK